MAKKPKKIAKKDWFGELIWWTKLVVAVLAVPSVGFVAAAMIKNPVAQMVVFVLSCWACTWIGMRLMKMVDK